MTEQTTEVAAGRTRTAIEQAPGKTLLSIGGVLAAVASMSCCVVPFALFFVGVSGAWIGNLTALAPYKPVFVAVTLACLAAGFVAVYRKPGAACAEGAACASRTSDRAVKSMLWAASLMVGVALAFPYAVELFYEY